MISLGTSQKGECRKENQDAILMRSQSKSGLFIVSDGVGGSKNGAVASAMLVDTFSRWWDESFLPHFSTSFMELFNNIKSSLETLNFELWQEYGTGNCCTTLVLLFIHQNIYGYISVGDSRLYHSNWKKVRLLTRDDTWENLPDTNDDIHNGKIISAVGGYQHLDYSSATDQLQRRDCFMLCSDGIYKFLEEHRLNKLLRDVNHSLFLKEFHINSFIWEAKKNHSDDNYSLVLVKT